VKLHVVPAHQDDDDDIPVRFIPPDGKDEWKPVAEWVALDWSHWLQQHGWNQGRIHQYLSVDRYKYGFGLRRTDSSPFTWMYLPVPAAVPLHASTSPNLLYGGAAGGTKSHSTRWDAYRYCFSIPEYRSIIMRRTFEELRRNHIDKSVIEAEKINAWFGREVMQVVRSEHEIRFPLNNAKITFGHCQNVGDEEKYLGDEYDDFRPDEMATFEKEQIAGVQGRLRSTKPGIRARLVGTSNPGGAHTLWLKQWFIDRNVTKQENARYRPADYQYIPARLYDNPWLMDPDGTFTEYENRLYMYSRQRRRQLLNGDWNAVTGQFFDEWAPGRLVGHVPIPAGCAIERWIDWGYSKPGVCHWVACLPNGRLYVFAEWVFSGTIASEVAKRIHQLTKDEVLPITKGRLTRTIADPSMFAISGHTGESYADTFKKNHVSLTPGDNDRVLGWGRLRHWYRKHPDDAGAWLIYNPDCDYAIRTIPSLIHSTVDPEDLNTDGEDHAADADRYGVMARPSPSVIVRQRSIVLPDSIRGMLRSLDQRPRQIGQVN